MSNITLELTNGSAEVLYGILVEEVEQTTSELKARRILNKDGSRKQSRKHLGEYDQYLLDKRLVASTLYEYLEPQLNSFKEGSDATQDPKREEGEE